MGMHSMWFHHFNTRKRIKKRSKRLENKIATKIVDEKFKNIGYDHIEVKNSKIQRIMDKFIFLIALIWPILTIPQVWMVWVEQNAWWISLFTWTAYVVSPSLWLVYGIIHKEKAIIFSNILWIIVDFAVLLWAIIYG